ncbi:MAG: c-type cytochrome [Planctomycetaceae bacterium]|nr:c-type cytochrome [Planctomycetaceae bacterium]
MSRYDMSTIGVNRSASQRSLAVAGVVCALMITLSAVAVAGEDEQDRPFGLSLRIPWVKSRLVGSPDPPRPYVATKMFAGIQWDRPIYLKPEPDGKHLFVIEQGGEENRPSKLLRIVGRTEVTEKTLLLSVPRRLVYGMEFHPNYLENGYIYLFSNGSTGESERLNRVTRYTVRREGEQATCDPSSAVDIIQWRSMGHDGGDLVFGNDGFLYITSGDGTGDSDQWLSAQDVTNLLGGVLRIDVDRPSDDKPYSVPADNPFLNIAGARGELWAIGLRNPWRMSINKKTGQIWVGNNGQDLWETAHLLRKGENYGWSVYEGSHPFYAHRELGPGNLVAPTFEHHHTESRSLTGGVTYNGDRLKNLVGAYIYGDYSTGKIWAGRHDGQQVTYHQEIADTSLSIVAFSNSHRGDLVVVDSVQGMYRLEPNPDLDRLDELPVFPTKLSDTGLFESTDNHKVAAGVIPYDVVSPGWADGAKADRFIALPEELQIAYSPDRGWNFPDRSVLVQTLSIDETHQGEIRKRRLETRVLLKQQNEWQAYSYWWNEEQSEAELVASDGKDVSLADGHVWRVPSRAECISCHARAVNYVLGLSDLQMNRDFNYSGTVDNQLRTFSHIGLLAGYAPKPEAKRLKLVNPHDPSASLTDRARSYLHTNCACCHVAAGGGNARMELEFTAKTESMRILDEYPQHATFGLTQPRIVALGDPSQSVLLARISRRGRGQMPPLVSNQVDESAVRLLGEWIASMPSQRQFVRDWSVADLTEDLSTLQEDRSLVRGKALFRSSGCGHCHRIEEELAGIGPNLSGIAERRKPIEILESVITPSAKIEPKYASTVLVTSDGEVFQGRIHSETNEEIVLRGQESFAQSQRVRKANVEERALSRLSMMPEGTIDHLQRDEILDLLAYVLAGKASDE